MGQEYTTKEEVKRWLSITLRAYVALREEVEEKDRLLKTYGEMVHRSNECGIKEIQAREQLKADNEALRALLLDKQH